VVYTVGLPLHCAWIAEYAAILCATWRRPRAKEHTDSRDSSDDLSELELVENSGFTSSIQSDHEDSYPSVTLLQQSPSRRKEWGALSYL
jgi:hypothetical protein